MRLTRDLDRRGSRSSASLVARAVVMVDDQRRDHARARRVPGGRERQAQARDRYFVVKPNDTGKSELPARSAIDPDSDTVMCVATGNAAVGVNV
jgi:hypothetical protein